MPKIIRQNTVDKKQSSKSSVLDRIMDLGDVPDCGIKFGIYGKSGTGKTRLMASFAKAGKLLHIICSSNGTNESRSIKGTKNIQVVELLATSDITELVKYAKDNKFKTIALDHVTSFCDVALSEIINKPIPEQASWGLATQQQYQQMSLKVKTYLRELLDFEGNTILIGQERVFEKFKAAGEEEDVDELLQIPNISIATTPSVAGWIAPAVDYFAQTFKRDEVIVSKKTMGGKEIINERKTGKVEYCLRVGPSAMYLTKFRVPPGIELPDVIVDPSYDKIMQVIEGDE